VKERRRKETEGGKGEKEGMERWKGEAREEDIYMYIYIYIHIYIYTYIHTYIFSYLSISISISVYVDLINRGGKPKCVHLLFEGCACWSQKERRTESTERNEGRADGRMNEGRKGDGTQQRAEIRWWVVNSGD
jgi:hypothetical protein